MVFQVTGDDIRHLFQCLFNIKFTTCHNFLLIVTNKNVNQHEILLISDSVRLCY